MEYFKHVAVITNVQEELTKKYQQEMKDDAS
jgi:hypothetical protein